MYVRMYAFKGFWVNHHVLVLLLIEFILLVYYGLHRGSQSRLHALSRLAC